MFGLCLQLIADRFSQTARRVLPLRAPQLATFVTKHILHIVSSYQWSTDLTRASDIGWLGCSFT